MQERRNSSALAVELHLSYIYLHIDGFVQERRNSSALAVELLLSYSYPPIYGRDL